MEKAVSLDRLRSVILTHEHILFSSIVLLRPNCIFIACIIELEILSAQEDAGDAVDAGAESKRSDPLTIQSLENRVTGEFSSHLDF